MPRNDRVPALLLENRIEEEIQAPPGVDEWTYESAATLCRRLDLSLTKFLILISDNRDSVEVYDVPPRSVRYKTMDVLRLMRKRH